jgi:oligogalacturonide lyase
MAYVIRLCVMAALAGAVGCSQAQPVPTSQPVSVGVDLNTGASYTIQANTQPPPKEWIDPDTGHRVVRLSDEPNSQSLYFNVWAYSPDGRKMAFFSPTGIYQIDLQTRQIELILPGETMQGAERVRNNIIVVGRKTGHIFFTRTVVSATANQAAGGPVSQDRGSAARSVWWIDPATREQHEIGTVPPGYNVGTVNADETLLAGAVTYLDGRGGAATRPVTAARGQRINLGARWAQHLPMALITMDAQTGQIKTFNPSNDWDNHFQFSPTDPALLMYCHEGPWQNNDRVWMIHADGSGLWKVHARTMIDEIWGHEFWSADGGTAWYQLNYPRGLGGTAWIAGTNVRTHREIWYHLEDGTTSIHVNVSADGSLFAGDGNNETKWIMLHRPILDRNLAARVYDTSHMIQPGYMETERLVNMSRHQYQLEPNVNFTPDMKWIVFRSNMFGPSYVFMVEVARAK